MSVSDLSTVHPHSALFTIRIWHETLGAELGAVRMQVKHVLSGETRYFRDWVQLTKYLEDKVQAPQQVEPWYRETTDQP